MSIEQRLKEMEDRLLKLDAERASLLREIQNLRNEIAVESKSNRALRGRPLARKELLTNADKVQLFLQLFAARLDVYPQRWENKKTGKSGYSPVCANEWIDPICKKPKVKCTDCSHQNFLSLDELAVESHLRGNSTIGTYAIRSDDSCRFLACDFDESSWQQDVLTFQDAALSLGIEVAIERSRSGNGAHAWIFFEEPISAKIARSLGTLILAKCSEHNLRLSLESYDRFFPSQDYLPKGGFGNLIALPLQKIARENGNCSFVNDQFIPYHMLMHYLTSNVERNQLIAKHTIEALTENRFPMLISDRKEHLDVLSLIISETSNISGLEIIRLDGDLTTKKRRLALDKLLDFRKQNIKVLLISSASLIGEGFDLPDLDTMILAMPLSFEGRMIQYAGRIHRRVEGKIEARIIDYVDFGSPVLVKMYRNRLKAYQQMNYSIEEPRKLLGPMAQYALTKSFL